MYRNHLKHALGAVLAGLLAGFTAAAVAAHPGMSQEVDGLTVYLGVMSADRLAEHPELLPEGHPIRAGKDMYHVLVAIFDSATGQRITDATVDTMVSPLGLAGSTRVMHRSPPDEMVTYCNFFRLPSGDTYVIRVRIRRPGIQAVRTARFTFKSFAG